LHTTSVATENVIILMNILQCFAYLPVEVRVRIKLHKKRFGSSCYKIDVEVAVRNLPTCCRPNESWNSLLLLS